MPADASQNINVIGASGILVTGNPGTNTLTITSSAADLHISPFIVSANGAVDGANFTTIQAALNAANAVGGGAVYVQPGTYTEDLTLFDNTQVVGATGASYAGTTSGTIIVGVHTPPATGSFIFSQVFLSSATDIFSSAVAGDALLIINQCNVSVANGYTFNLPNWVGTMAKTLVENASANNGICFNTGGGVLYIQNSNASSPGSTNVLTTSGPVIIKKCEINTPVLFGAGTNFNVDRAIFNDTVTFSGDAAGEMTFCAFTTFGPAAITNSSSGLINISNCTVQSPNVEAIDGAGVGLLRLSQITYKSTPNIAPTLTVQGAPLVFSGNNLLTGTANSANLNLHTITNPSDTSFSQASQLISVGGTSSGEPWTQYTVGSSISYSLGIDTQNTTGIGAQALVISSSQSASSAPSTANPLLSFTSAATSLATAAIFWCPSVAIGGLINPGLTSNLNITNVSTTAASDASLLISTSTTGGGNPFISYSSLGNNWWHGVDKTASSNTFRFQYGNTGTFPALANILTMTTAGNINHPLNSSFNATSAVGTNVTGDGTAYTVIFGTVSYDQNSNYNNGTGVFTAPVAGRYHFSTGVTISSLIAGHTSGLLQIVTTGATYNGYQGAPFASAIVANGALCLNMSCYANMAAGDTAEVVITVTGSTKTVNTNSCYFGGRLAD